MTRWLNIFNTALLLLLGGLCLLQWSEEKTYAQRIHGLQSTAIAQADKLVAQEDAIRRTTDDLDGFKTQVSALKTQADSQVAEIRDHKAQIFSLQQERGKLERQSAAWQQSIEEYKKAVSIRDENIRTLLDQRDSLHSANKDAATKANQAIAAYNELATKYEELVTNYNTLATRYKAEHETAAQ